MKLLISYFFFFNDTATTEIYTLSLHDALPIYPVAFRELLEIGDPRYGPVGEPLQPLDGFGDVRRGVIGDGAEQDRKSTRLNSSHANISYAVFCLKKKKYKIVMIY